MRRHLSLTVAMTGMALVAAACTGQSSGAPTSMPQSVSVTTTGTALSNASTSATHNPQTVVDALNAAGLALCHSDYSDDAQYDIFGFLGATATWRFFPHHSAEPVPAIAWINGPPVSCVTSSQPNTGVIEIDLYPSAAVASAALRQVRHLWLDAWLYGNVAILVDETTPGPIAQEESAVLDDLPGTSQIP